MYHPPLKNLTSVFQGSITIKRLSCGITFIAIMMPAQVDICKRAVITSLNACIGGAVNARSDDDTAAHQMVFMLHHAFGAAFLVHDFFIRPGVIMLCHGMLAREGALII